MRITPGLSALGSSPRVRGKRGARRRRRGAHGLIPARAGKTAARRWCSLSCPAHPRACGENGLAEHSDVGVEGSSPRVRGKLVQLPRRDVLPGLIPARAGKTFSGNHKLCFFKAHPRACGENRGIVIHTHVPIGSSPRVRGKQKPRIGVTGFVGLIPARAGKTATASCGSTARGAHPRACGENSRAASIGATLSGSSPRVRGKPCASAFAHGVGGLIPARAGKTGYSPTTLQPGWAHPRACGENAMTTGAPRGAWGSSPRVRGKHIVRGPQAARLRLIPARAGKPTITHRGR